MVESDGRQSTGRRAGDASAIRNYPLLLRRYQQLMEISRVLGSTLELPALLRQIIEAARELTHTEAASILLIDPRTGELRFEASTQVDTSQMDSIMVPKEGSIAGWIVSHDEPLVIADVTQDPRHYQQVDKKVDFVTRSLLGVPLKTRDKTIGVLEAINKRGGGFSPDDADTLEILAAQAAVAIETARLFQQSDLVAEMVHELRTPLAALTATSHLLLRSDLPEERRAEFVRTIQQETLRLTSMTSDFLDLARLESGRARFVRAPFAMPELVAECVGIIQPQAHDRSIALRVEVPDVPRTVSGDRAKIKQVVLNLLTNAIKYNREGGTIVVRGAGDQNSYELSVADTGKGIPPDSLPRIFEKFYRVADTEGWTQGTGLGLAIAKKIVETHGGEMTVESQVGVGATFRFTLPFETGGKR
ncbi:MAG: GAF domain-containing sensor histidine kinase [Chloroflexi bacterium]|nr:GAF domain-containing sensor histidine kinase [Chloroflexota bacterium]